MRAACHYWQKIVFRCKWTDFGAYHFVQENTQTPIVGGLIVSPIQNYLGSSYAKEKAKNA
jgi:hypothetical protein